MATLLADPATGPAPEAVSQPAGGAPDGGPPPTAGSAPAAGTACARCGAPLAEGQGWCLQCGAAAPGSLGGSSWRPTATIAALALALVLGAAAAAYAAMTSSGPKRRTLVATVVTPAPATPPAGTTAGAPAGTTAGAPAGTTPSTPPGTAGTGAGSTLPGLVKPPKIPLAQVTPKALPKVAIPPVTVPKTTSTTPAGTTGGKAAKPKPILLDTNAASTYNPTGYPATAFGEPGMAIDGETSTAWTAQVDPAIAPRMAAGLLVDLRTPHHVSALQVVTATPGITVQAFGTDATTAPATVTDPAWVKLMPRPKVLANRHSHIALSQTTHGYRLVLLWISHVPASVVGTEQAPGVVRVNELELFPVA